MKRAIKGLGIAVLAVMFAFAWAGCEEDEDPPSPTPVVSTPIPTPTPIPTGTVINIATIKGVVVPAYKLTPVKEITENAQFSGTVKWNGNPSTFDKDTEYTAIITLTPKTGYTLHGVTTDFFNVAGAKSVSNAVNSGVITAVFPKTETNYVTDIKIEKQPAKLIYMQGDELSLSGLAVTLTYNDATKEENLSYVHLPLKSITTDPEDGEKLDFTKHNGKPIKIAYGKIAYSDLIYTTNNLDINTPTAEDFEINGLTQEYDGSPKTVDITRKEGKSTGTITVKYNGSTTAPSDVGTYTVTFDVAAVTNFNAASGLSTGSLTIEKSTPTAADFNISGLTQGYDGSFKAVTITPKEGKSTGDITVYYEGTGSTTYTKNTTAPSTGGTYTVTFDVAAVTNYNAVSGLSAGTLTINKGNPTAADFDISGLTQDYDGSPKTVTITPKEGKSTGTITVKYNGSTTAPSVGIYTVTFDVAATTNYNAVNGLSAGTLTITGAVAFYSVTADGSASQSSTQLTLTFSQAITNLSESDITLSGVSDVTKGYLNRSGATYTLPIYGFNTGGTLTVAVAKSGINIINTPNGTPKTVTIYYYYYNGVSPGTIEMVSIPAGTFTMGSPSTESGSYDRERPQHSVTLSSFKMGKYEVTQEQYEAVMGNNPSNFSSNPQAGETQGKRPVERVSWYDAIIFCNKLSILEGLSPAYRISGSTDPAVWGTVPTNMDSTWDAVEIVAGSTGYRLPTEAQWEYACRAGTTTAYNTGDTISDNTGWYKSNSGYKTHEVGLKPANAWGLYDMHGNVWEWCWDWYGDYSSGAQTNPVGADAGSYRVFRGGSWDTSASYARSSGRGYGDPGDGDVDFGFRLVRP